MKKANCHPSDQSLNELQGRLVGIKSCEGGLQLQIRRNFVDFYRVIETATYQSSNCSLGDLIDYRGPRQLKPLVKSSASRPQLAKDFTLADALAWQDLVARLRDFFRQQDFVELATPSLVTCPGMEIHLEPFATEIRRGQRHRQCYLPTSPELHLKKALCLGYDRVFEIAKVFRNNEQGKNHQLEFWMLEWYRAYSDLAAIQQDTQALVQSFFGQETKIAELHFTDLFREYCDFSYRSDCSAAQLQELCQRWSIEFSLTDSFDDLFFRIFLEKIEPQLATQGWYFLKGFPPSQAALAKLDSQGFADRFELYYGDLELANAFHELNDVGEQERRFLQAQQQRREQGLDVVPVDEDFLAHLAYGMPPSGGIALGVDRLFMLWQKKTSLEQTRLFPYLDK